MDFLGVSFSSDISLGAVLVGSLIAVVGAAIGIKYKAGADSLAVHNQSLLARLADEREAKHTAHAELNGLRLTRDLTPVLEALTELTGRHIANQEETEHRYGMAMKEVQELFASHEGRAQERHQKQIEALEAINESLHKLNGR